VLFDSDAPWTLVCITDDADLLARCSRVVTLNGGQFGDPDRHSSEEVEA
jgi:hypothetical protein